MREIKFRGQHAGSLRWYYGGYHKHEVVTVCPLDNTPIEYQHLIVQSGFRDWNLPKPIQAVEVIPETVGQFIGIQDRSGTDIFEGDIVQLFCPWFRQSRSVLGVVFYNKTEFLIKGRGFTRDLSGIEIDDGWAGGSIKVEYKVVGNIYDNHELISKEIEL